MNFHSTLIPGRLVRRYKRFLAEIELTSGEIITAHCTNSGSMKSCMEVGAPVMVSQTDNMNRKTRYTWEMIFINEGWVGVNTLIPNALVYNALMNNSIQSLQSNTVVKKEVKTGASRIDFFVRSSDQNCYIEVKNVSMKVGSYARFPDSVTIRGKKHLEELIRLKLEGFRAVMIYIIQRMDISRFGPAFEIDPSYSKTLIEAHKQGVEIIPLMAKVKPSGVKLMKDIPFDLKIAENK